MSRLPLVLAILALLSFPALAQLKCEPHEDNMVGDRLVGSWSIDADVAKRLLGDEFPEGLKIGITFAADSSVLGKISEDIAEDVSERELRIYAAGTIEVREGEGEIKNYLYAVTAMGGRPLLLVLEGEGDEMDAESSFFFLVPGSEKKSDLLFIGGDHTGEPFIALRRDGGGDDEDEGDEGDMDKPGHEHDGSEDGGMGDGGMGGGR